MIKEKLNYPTLLREVRKQLGISQEDLARELGVSFNSINRWENGKVAPSKLAQNQIEALIQGLIEEKRLKLPKSLWLI